MWHTQKCNNFSSVQTRSGRWPSMFFMILGTYRNQTFIGFSPAQRIQLMIFSCHTVTHGTDLRRSPHICAQTNYLFEWPLWQAERGLTFLVFWFGQFGWNLLFYTLDLRWHSIGDRPTAKLCFPDSINLSLYSTLAISWMEINLIQAFVSMQRSTLTKLKMLF